MNFTNNRGDSFEYEAGLAGMVTITTKDGGKVEIPGGVLLAFLVEAYIRPRAITRAVTASEDELLGFAKR